MNLSINNISSTQTIIIVEGRLDAETANAFKEKAKEIAASGVKYLTINMNGLTFIDSSGLAALVSALKAIRQNGGMLNLACVGSQAKTALRLTMLDKILTMYETVDDATTKIKVN